MAIFPEEHCHLATRGPGQGATQTLPRLYIKQDVPLVQNFVLQGLGFRLQGSHCAHGQGSFTCSRTFTIWRNNLQLVKKKPIHNLDKYNSHSAPAALSAVYNSITSMEWNGFDHPVRSVGVTLEGFLLMDCAAGRSGRTQRRCCIFEIALTTCWQHTTLARYGYECPCLLLNVYLYKYIHICMGFIYHFLNIMNN